MRKANVYRNNEFVGILSEENPTLFVFQYDENWLLDSSKPSVSLTLPKAQKVFTSPNLFPALPTLSPCRVNIFPI